MKRPHKLAEHLGAAIILLLANNPSPVVADGFSVNGGGQQTGPVVGVVSGNDNLVASGVFAGSFSQNPGNSGTAETVTINSDAIITPPSGSGVANYWLQTNGDPSTNNFNGLIEVNQGTLNNLGTINGTFSSLPASSGLFGLDTYVSGANPSDTNQVYNYGIGVMAWCGQASIYGSSSIVNGSPANSSATIKGLVTGGGQNFAMGIYSLQYYGPSSGADISIANYGTIDGEVTNYDGTAAGIFNYSLYGGLNVTNFSGGTCSATARYYTTGIYDSSYYGPVNVVNGGTATASSTGGLQGATANEAYAVAIDTFTYDNGSAAPTYLLNTGTAAATCGGANSFAYGIFEWVEGGAMTLTNSGAVTASAACVKTIYCGGNRGPVLVNNSGTVAGNAGSGGGWGVGAENDGNNSVTIINSGSISHNNGLGVALFAGYGPAVVSNTVSGSISGGLEGISTETFNGPVTIYNYGSIQSSGNAISLGTNDDTVYLYGLPTVNGTMNGGGGSNTLAFQLAGTLQSVNGANAAHGTNLSAYNLGTSGYIIVSGQTYSWANFHVSGSVTGSVATLPAQVTIPLTNPGFETRGGGIAIGGTKLTGGFGAPGNTLDGWLDAGSNYSDSGVDYNGDNNFTANSGSHAAFGKGGDPGGYQIVPGYQIRSGDTLTLTWWAKSTYQNAQQLVRLLSAAATNTPYGSLTTLTSLTGTLGGNANNAAYTSYSLTYVAGAADVGRYVALSFSNPNAGGNGGNNWAAWDDFNVSVALADFAVAPSPGIQPSGSNLRITWPYGTLLQATNIAGPWTTNAATSPYLTAPTAPNLFFRVQLP